MNQLIKKEKERIKIYTYEQILQDKEKYDVVSSYLRFYGSHTISYSILQPNMNYFIVEDIGLIGYAKYKRYSKTRYVLGDPLVSEENLLGLIKIFLNKFPKTYFVQISKEVAINMSKKFKMYSTPLGIETNIDINQFNIEGSEKRKLRNNIRNCKKLINIYEINEIDIDKKELIKISQEWLRYKKNNKNEISFLTKPFNLKEEIDTRIFIAKTEDKTLGFMIFNPIYNNNSIIGYTADITRVSKDAPRGTGDYLIYLAIKKFKREGLKILNLGLSPFADLDKDRLNFKDKYSLKFVKVLYDKTDSIYHFKGLAEHKKQFNGKENHVYFVHKKTFPIFDILRLFKICKVI